MSIATLSNAASTLTNSSDANTINQTAQYFDEANSNKVKSNLSSYPNNSDFNPSSKEGEIGIGPSKNQSMDDPFPSHENTSDKHSTDKESFESRMNSSETISPGIGIDKKHDATIPSVEDMLKDKAELHEHEHNRNYASKECGAKILFANAEAENRGAILNDPERDDYMRNPCKADKFFIIELCETIQLTSLELANFELFASTPKDFKLYSSERYPSQEWTFVGEFQAQDIKRIQHFKIPEQTTYAKFLKVDLLTHYGKEHYCTLSTMRVYGISYIDEYEAEAASATASANLQQQATADSMLNSGDLSKVNLKNDQEDESQSKLPLLAGSDKIENHTEITTVERLKKDSKEMGYVGTNTSKPLPVSSTNKSDDECPLPTNDYFHTSPNIKEGPNVTQRNSEEHRSNNVSITNDKFTDQRIENTSNATREFIDAEQQDRELIDERTIQKTKEIGSTNNYDDKKNPGFLKAVVDVVSDEVDKAKKALKSILFTSSKGTDPIFAGEYNRTLRPSSLSYFMTNCGTANAGFCLMDEPQNLQSIPLFWYIFCFYKRAKYLEKRGPNTKASGINDRTKNSQAYLLAQILPIKKCLVNESINKSISEPQTQQNEELMPEKQLNAALPTMPKVMEKGILSPLPGTSTTHKESVFMKLNKRLAQLEMNMSFSSDFLHELSKRYLAQNNDIVQQNERLKQTNLESKRVEQNMREQIEALRIELNALRKIVHTYEMEKQQAHKQKNHGFSCNWPYVVETVATPSRAIMPQIVNGIGHKTNPDQAPRIKDINTQYMNYEIGGIGSDPNNWDNWHSDNDRCKIRQYHQRYPHQSSSVLQVSDNSELFRRSQQYWNWTTEQVIAISIAIHILMLVIYKSIFYIVNMLLKQWNLIVNRRNKSNQTTERATNGTTNGTAHLF